ncbi:hypothetical protein VB715_02535 [Crocosphaera sp. UHCC 0190]|uniref:DUF7305 domain-containing protein n=1 Tax=Crocosphaera sp. UHCC 0190 TaxID=3110246 RepID=UPI002B1F3BA9|nr:hypothetical protein [Crocosphaera sp. UHCC 0190]MEA5508632.1 hypothetical protein [Crocosphaera sp. UHCC 0190]
MNPKLRLILLHRPNNQGFALPFTLCVGVVMMLAGTIMLVKSQANRSHVQAQQTTSEGISAAEVGVTRITTLMNDNRYIAMYPDCIGRDSGGNCTDSGTTESWANISNIPKLTVCESGEAADVEDVSLKQEWQPIDPDNPHQGDYRLLKYEYPTPGKAPNVGKLTVEGRVRTSNENKEATSQLEVDVPVSPGPVENTNVPGVWLADDPDATGGNGIEGDVLLGNCDSPTDTVNVKGSDPITGEPYEAKHTNLEFPDLPEIPDTAIYLGVMGENKDGSLTATSGDITLPRAGDTYTTKTINGQSVQVYEYKVDQINFNSGSHSLTVTPGKQVSLYLQGSMVVKSNSNIIHNCDDSGNPISGCKPTDFKIYGYGDNTNTICTAGNKRIEAFIFAPEYTVGTAGTGGGEGGIKGTIWANEWSNGKSCGSNTSNTAVVQTARWEDLGLQPKNTPPELSSTSTWQRNER